MIAHPLISDIEAVNIVGRAIFGQGWIGGIREREGKMICAGLSSEDMDLIERRGPRPGKRGGVSIEPCPPTIAPQLDQALGRRERANAQRGTAADWLIDRFAAQRGRDRSHHVILGYDQTAIVAALKADPPRTPDTAAKRGRTRIFETIGALMLHEVAIGKRTEAEITKANGKNLQKWYGADPSTCRKARQHAF